MSNLFIRSGAHRYASNSTDSLGNCLPVTAEPARTSELRRPHRNDRSTLTIPPRNTKNSYRK